MENILSVTRSHLLKQWKNMPVSFKGGTGTMIANDFVVKININLR